MSVVKKTNTKIDDVNIGKNDAKIYIVRKDDARKIAIDWKKKVEIHWNKYQIKETDRRIKTASFTTPQYLDLTTGMYCVMITSDMHEDFGGIILDVEYDNDNGLYSYNCQDFSRMYQGKFDLVTDGKSNYYRVLQYLITQGGVSWKGKAKKKQLKKYKKELSGLRPNWQYNTNKYWGNGIKLTPFAYKPKMIIRNKSYIEAIRDIVYGAGTNIDVYFNKYGILQIEPFHADDLKKNGLILTTPEIANAKYKFDTTNIVTGVHVHATDKLKTGKFYSSKNTIKLDLSAFFGNLSTSMDNPSQSTGKTSSGKTNNDNDKKDNPYNTKKKELELSFDNWKNPKTDQKFVNEVVKLLKKNGWKIKHAKRGSNMHSEKHMSIKNGVHFCIMNGVDAGMIREVSMNSSYVKKQKRLKCRTVWAWIRTDPNRKNDIRKGGNCEHRIGRAHDDDYSPSAFNGVSEPRKKLIKAKVPFMYGKNPKEIVDKFLAGGDEPECL